MSVVVIFAKLLVFALYGYSFYHIYQFKKQNRNVQITFDTLSSLEIAAGVGLALVCIVSVIDPTTYFFTLFLCCLSMIICFLQRRRIIVVGSKVAYIRNKAINIRDIKSISASLFSLILVTKQKTYRIYVPLTGRNVLKEKIADKIK